MKKTQRNEILEKTSETEKKEEIIKLLIFLVGGIVLGFISEFLMI